MVPFGAIRLPLGRPGSAWHDLTDGFTRRKNICRKLDLEGNHPLLQFALRHRSDLMECLAGSPASTGGLSLEKTISETDA